MILTYPGLTCRRRKGKLVIEIPETEVLFDAIAFDEPAGIRVTVRNKEAFFDELAAEILQVEDDGGGAAQSQVRQMVRSAAYRVAEAGLSAQYAELR